MGNVTFEAITIGLNTIVFGIALSVAMLLMVQVNNVVEFATSKDETIPSGNLAETYGKIEERKFTGAELYAFYSQKELNQTDVVFKVGSYTLKDYIEGVNVNDILGTNYILLQEGEKEYKFLAVE